MAIYRELDTYLQYEQPTKYIVNTEDYSDEYSTPVLTAGKTFILGYTNEIEGIFQASQEPVIIFDDFTSSIQYVNFDFKVKSSAMKILHKINDEDNLKYLFYAMKCLRFTPFSHKRLWISEYSKLKIQHRSSQEQNKIASELNNIEQGIKVKEEQLKALDELIQSRFTEIFGDIHTNKFGWSIKKMEEIATCIAGATPSTLKEEYWEGGTIPWLSSGEVHKGRIFDTDKKITELGYSNCSTKLIPAHTVVLALAGQGKTRGTVAVAEIRLCTNQSICSIVTNQSINTDYLYYYLKSQYQALRDASNGAGGRGGLNLKIVGHFKILLPPLPLQNQFAEFVQKVEKAKEIVKIQIKDLQELLALKMDEYFK